MLKMPPASTAPVASAGSLSFLKYAASIWLNRKNGIANLIGSTYSRASVSVLSCAPKTTSSSLSNKIITSQMIAARTTEPITDAVKYSLDLLISPSAFPLIVLKRTDPPIPIRSPTTKCRRQILEVDCFDLSAQKIHFLILL